MNSGVAGLSGALALVLLLPMEAGVPIFWRVRRRHRAAAPAAWMEATCPACIGVSLLAERVPGLAGLTRLDPVGPADPGPEDDRQVLVH
jgi:hypothetical protein